MHISTMSGLVLSTDRIITNLLRPGSPVREELVSAGKRGGYLCIARLDGIPLLVVRVGEPDEAKLARYIEFCQEKAARLAQNPDHVLSRASRDPDQNRFGGAVRGKDYIASFSGFPEDLDEVVSAMTLSTVDISFGEAMDRVGDNPYLIKIGHRALSALVD